MRTSTIACVLFVSWTASPAAWAAPADEKSEKKEPAEKKSGKDEKQAKIDAGKPAPDFTLKDEEGKELKLSSLRGKKNVLIAFYPRDFTSGCTSELKRFRTEHDVFVKSQVQILGISTDPVDSHKKFCAELKLPFPLLADEGGKVSKMYGILISRPNGEVMSGRSVFLIDREGIVRHADPQYDLGKEDDHDTLIERVKGLGEKAGKSPEASKKEKKTDEGKAEGKEKTARAGDAAPSSQPAVSSLEFGRIVVNGRAYENDVVFENGRVRERDKRPSKGEREKYGHTPLTPREEIPWDCKSLVIGTGMQGRLPVPDELKSEAKRRGVELILLPTPDAVEHLKKMPAAGVNAILHITC